MKEMEIDVFTTEPAIKIGREQTIGQMNQSSDKLTEKRNKSETNLPIYSKTTIR